MSRSAHRRASATRENLQRALCRTRLIDLAICVAAADLIDLDAELLQALEIFLQIFVTDIRRKDVRDMFFSHIETSSAGV
jgi:hypothetical protein